MQLHLLQVPPAPARLQLVVAAAPGGTPEAHPTVLFTSAPVRPLPLLVHRARPTGQVGRLSCGCVQVLSTCSPLFDDISIVPQGAVAQAVEQHDVRIVVVALPARHAPAASLVAGTCGVRDAMGARAAVPQPRTAAESPPARAAAAAPGGLTPRRAFPFAWQFQRATTPARNEDSANGEAQADGFVHGTPELLAQQSALSQLSTISERRSSPSEAAARVDVIAQAGAHGSTAELGVMRTPEAAVNGRSPAALRTPSASPLNAPGAPRQGPAPHLVSPAALGAAPMPTELRRVLSGDTGSPPPQWVVPLGSGLAAQPRVRVSLDVEAVAARVAVRLAVADAAAAGADGAIKADCIDAAAGGAITSERPLLRVRTGSTRLSAMPGGDVSPPAAGTWHLDPGTGAAVLFDACLSLSTDAYDMRQPLPPGLQPAALPPRTLLLGLAGGCVSGGGGTAAGDDTAMLPALFVFPKPAAPALAAFCEANDWLQKPPSQAKAASPSSTPSLMSAIRKAFFPFQGVSRTPANLPRTHSSPGLRPVGHSPRASFAGTSSPGMVPNITAAHTGSPRHVRRRSTASVGFAAPLSALRRGGAVRARAAPHDASLAGVSAASERSCPSELSGPGAKANTEPHHNRSASFGSAMPLLEQHSLLSDGADGGAAAGQSVLQYASITLPMLQRQTAAIVAFEERRQTAAERLSAMAAADSVRSNARARLHRLEARVAAVRLSPLPLRQRLFDRGPRGRAQLHSSPCYQPHRRN